MHMDIMTIIRNRWRLLRELFFKQPKQTKKRRQDELNTNLWSYFGDDYDWESERIQRFGVEIVQKLKKNVRGRRDRWLK